jgi:hypothetical protein
LRKLSHQIEILEKFYNREMIRRYPVVRQDIDVVAAWLKEVAPARIIDFGALCGSLAIALRRMDVDLTDRMLAIEPLKEVAESSRHLYEFMSTLPGVYGLNEVSEHLLEKSVFVAISTIYQIPPEGVSEILDYLINEPKIEFIILGFDEIYPEYSKIVFEETKIVFYDHRGLVESRLSDDKWDADILFDGVMAKSLTTLHDLKSQHILFKRK